MTAAVIAIPSRSRPATGTLLVAGIVLASLTEAIASTVLSLGRGDIIGDTYATPDEFAWLDVGYTAPKLIGFMTAPWLLSRINPRSLIVGATLVMGMACAVAAITARLDVLVVLRIIQGFSEAPCSSEGRRSSFLSIRDTNNPSFKPCSQWERSLPPQRLPRRFRAGCSTASRGRGYSSASFRWRWRRLDSCCLRTVRRRSRLRAVHSTGSDSHSFLYRSSASLTS